MKKLYLLIVFLCIFLLPVLGQVSQAGKIIELNSGHRPVANVTVKVQNAPATITDDQGNFRLQISYQKPGDKILVEEISKKGYEVVNMKDLEHWILSPGTSTIIYMAKRGSIDQARIAYYQIGEDNILRIYNQNKEQYKEQLEKQFITIEKYQEELRKAYDDRSKALSQLEQLADKFARINKDDMDSLNLKALQLFEQGRLSEVIVLYENEQAREKLSKKIVQHQELRDDMDQLVHILLNENDYRQLLGGKKQYEQIELNLKEILQADTANVEYLKIYTDFLYEMGQYDPAVKMTEKWIPLENDSVEMAKGYYSIAQAYLTMRQYSIAEAPLNKALALLERTAGTTDGGNALLAKVYRLKSTLLLETAHKEEAERYLQLSIDALNQAVNINQYHTEVARNYQFLGFFLERNMEYLKAIEAFKTADSLYKKCYDELTVQGKINYCSTLNEIGNCYNQIDNLDYAHHYLVKSYQLSKELAKDSLNVYLENMAYCANNLGVFYNNIDYCAEAIQYLSEAVKVYEQTAPAKATELYNAYLNLGNSFKRTGHYDTSIVYYGKALELAVMRYTEEPVAAKMEDLAVVEDQLGAVLNMSGHNEEATTHFTHSITLYRQLNAERTLMSQYYLACALNNAGSNYLDMNQPKAALKLLNESIAINKKLAKEYPQDFLPALASVYNNIGYYYGTKKNYKKAIQYISHSGEYLEELARLNPNFEIKQLILNANNIAFLQHQAGNLDESLAIYVSTIERLRSAIEKSGTAYLPYLASMLENEGNLFVDLGRKEEAKKNYTESLSIYQTLLSGAPDTYQPLMDRITGKLDKLDE